jgi:hypothetical protein
MRMEYRILVGKLEGKRPLKRPGPRWVSNVKVNLKEIGCEGMKWIHVAQDRIQCSSFFSTVINPRLL